MTINGEIGDQILAEFEAAIQPGLHEYELLAALGNAPLTLPRRNPAHPPDRFWHEHQPVG